MDLTSLPHICLNGKVIDLVLNVKLSGVLLDTRLNWQSHISCLAGRLSGVIAIIYKLRKVLGHKWLMKLYYTHFVPLLV